jgi:hypothetical protein
MIAACCVYSFVSSIAIVAVSHNALSGCLGSEASFASRALYLLVALARDPIACVGSKVTCSCFKSRVNGRFIICSAASSAVFKSILQSWLYLARPCRLPQTGC